MNSKRSVLIVDESDETRTVLRTALERGGAEIWEAREPEQGLRMVREHHPAVIVLDLELDSANRLGDAFCEESQAQHAPLVLLGSARRVRQQFPSGEFVAKPYHYGPLILKIEQLLDQSRPARAKAA